MSCATTCISGLLKSLIRSGASFEWNRSYNHLIETFTYSLNNGLMLLFTKLLTEDRKRVAKARTLEFGLRIISTDLIHRYFLK